MGKCINNYNDFIMVYDVMQALKRIKNTIIGPDRLHYSHIKVLNENYISKW